MIPIVASISAGVFALLFAMVLASRVMKADQGNDTMRQIGRAIQEGAMAFLGREYRTLAIFVLIVTIVLGVFIDYLQFERAVPETAISYIVGALCSAGTGLSPLGLMFVLPLRQCRV